MTTASLNQSSATVPELPAHAYHERLAIERPPVWRGIVALALLIGGFFAFSAIFSGLGLLVDVLTGRYSGGQQVQITPAMLAGSMVALAMLTPWSMLLQKWFFRVPMRSLHSLRQVFRWGLLGRTAVIVIPIWAVYLAVFNLLMPAPTADYPVAELLAYFVIALTITPLQAAGEEYAFRGLVFRIAASWGRGPRSALLLGIAVSAILFMLAHFAFDPWLNLYYLTFGVSLAVITWRTGGIELAVMFHAVNNSLAFIVGAVLSSDVTKGFDRSAGVVNATMLLPSAMLAVAAAITWWRTRGGPARHQPATREPLTQ